MAVAVALIVVTAVAGRRVVAELVAVAFVGCMGRTLVDG